MKKVVAMLLVLVMSVNISGSSFAATSQSPSVDNFIAYSKEFPDAYIVKEFTETPRALQMPDADGKIKVGELTVTFHYEDILAVSENEIIQIGSRLLSKEEVENKETETPILPRAGSVQLFKPEGLLYLTFTVHKYPTGNKYQLTANAQWSRNTGLPALGIQAEQSGVDFMGILWGGSFNTEFHGGNIQYNLNGGNFDPGTSLNEIATLSNFEPNTGVVWSFHEAYAAGQGLERLANATTYVDINKNTLTGGGNKTQFAMKYIHTWQSVNGAVSIGMSGSLSFSLSNTPNQWSTFIATSEDGYPY